MQSMTLLTPEWYKLNYHPTQSALWRSKTPRQVVLAGRGSGKTTICRRKVVAHLGVKKPWADPMYFYALPTRDQAKRVAWEPLKRLVPHNWVSDVYESDLIIRTKFGSELHLLGMDKPHRAEGVQWDGGCIDERGDHKPKVISLNLGPAMTHRNTWLIELGVPKRTGPGQPEFTEAFHKGQDKANLDYEAFWWPSKDILPASIIEERKDSLDEVDFREQYEASIETIGGSIFHAFDEKENVTTAYEHNPDKPIIVGSDFNVDPMSWCLSHIHDGKFCTFDQIWKRNTNTQATMDNLWHRYGDKHKGSWIFIGDATGRARKSSAELTDYLIIQNDERFKPKRVLYPKGNPSRLDRFAACNRMLKSAAGVCRAFIHPRCEALISDLKHRAYKEGTRDVDDTGDLGHMSDAWGYPIALLFPIQYGLSSTPEVSHENL